MLDKNCVYSVKKAKHPDITKVVYTDASMHGWEHTVIEFQQEGHGFTQKIIHM